MPYRFFIVDVFTQRAFGGNQLAVFPEADGLAPATMQALAREFNFGETTFVLAPTDPACAARVRIFTPRAELAFAGHPTIGTTAVLAVLGRLPIASGCRAAMLEEGIGPVAVEAGVQEGPPFARFTLEPSLEMPGGAPAPADVARVLSLEPAQVREAAFASVGLPFCMVQLAEREAVDRATLDQAAWQTVFAAAWSNNIFLFAHGTAPRRDLYARMFAPALGVPEDPATGSACAALAALMAHRVPRPAGTFDWRFEQGVRMGRPSVINATAVKQDGRVSSVSIGGHSVIVAEGRMDVT
jgi:trans-2,3-dihydro-3-hydroxyanthranilate isomerase